MFDKVKKTLALAIAVVILASVPGLVGCGGGGGGGGQQITVGVLADLTGPASLAVTGYVRSFLDYIDYAQKQGWWPADVRIKALTYDQRSDPSRVPVGYEWLKGQGATAMFVVSPTDLRIIAASVVADKIPTICSNTAEDILASDYIYSWWPTPSSQGETEMLWIMNNWDYTGKGRPPRVGHEAFDLSGGVFYQSGIDSMLAAYPSKFQMVASIHSPAGTTTWAAEISKLKDCDFIIVTSVGPMMASFVIEARARGYEGNFISGTTGFPGYFSLVTSRLSADDLGGFYFIMPSPFYNDDLPLINEFRNAFQQIHPDIPYANLLGGDTAPIGGWVTGMFTIDAIVRAAKAVGSGMVTGEAINEALKTTNMEAEGFSPDGVWQFRNDYHALCRAYKVAEYHPSEGEWKDLPGWLVPPSLSAYQ
ncbi:MAG: ABC transporter substrate-binding protein [Chloroflexi bacterium]|nr:ABC transporter substrate-binding protein [Chloroflexota bacterium]